MQQYIDYFVSLYETLRTFLTELGNLFGLAFDFFPPYIQNAILLVLFAAGLFLIVKLIGLLVKVIGGAISAVLGLFV